MIDHAPHWSRLLAPIPAPDPFANLHPVSPWLPATIRDPATGYW